MTNIHQGTAGFTVLYWE